MNKLAILIVLLLVMILSSCSRSSIADYPPADVSQLASNVTQKVLSNPGTHTGNLTVFAAASLTGAFREIGREFEATNPGTKVNFNFAGSQILRTQLEQGAYADAFASADHKNMDPIIAEKLVNGAAQDFATNKLIVILAQGNPANISSLRDLTKPGIKLVLADSSVPAGNYARQVLVNIGSDPAYGKSFAETVLANIVSNETDVKQVVAKVELGEADAGIVYVSDAVAAPDLPIISIPDAFNVIARYPIAELVNSDQPELAQAFISYVLSPAGQSILERWGLSEVSH